jgi:hypothetical protein
MIALVRALSNVVDNGSFLDRVAGHPTKKSPPFTASATAAWPQRNFLLRVESPPLVGFLRQAFYLCSNAVLCNLRERKVTRRPRELMGSGGVIPEN